MCVYSGGGHGPYSNTTLFWMCRCEHTRFLMRGNGSGMNLGRKSIGEKSLANGKPEAFLAENEVAICLDTKAQCRGK